MNLDRAEFLNLVHAVLDGRATDDDIVRFNAYLRDDSAARDLYLELADMHSCLAVDERLWVEVPASQPAAVGQISRTFSRLSVAFCALAVVAAALLFLVLRGTRDVPLMPSHEELAGAVVARILELTDCRWVSPTFKGRAGDDVRRGERLELSSGTATVRFESGAIVKLFGPCILESTSESQAFLLLGQAVVDVSAPTAKGFIITTRTARLVDLGTEFAVAAAADGQSRVDVTVGTVDVSLEAVEATQRLTAGDALCVEPGERQIITRIERGDGTSTFRFPTIEPPSHRDFADKSQGHATIRAVGVLHRGDGPSGPVDVLLDGHGQSHEDAPNESAFFGNNEKGFFILDLGRAVSIEKINTYSWHQNTTFRQQRHRAVQKYTLYGSAADVAPPIEADLAAAGWVRLARVNSDDFFQVGPPLDRPPQQACSVTSARGSIGRYRHLLWEVEPTKGMGTVEMNHTFYGEFDVFAKP